MRNWTSHPAFRVAQFLFYYRLVGVLLFELTDERLMLLLFPNTFEYFFIAYEVARLRYEPSRFSARFWVLVAAGLWIFVKLPQEYWIHIAKLDFTDTVHDHPGFGVAVVVALVVAALVVSSSSSRGFRRPTGAGGFAADPLPPAAAEERGRILSEETLEKVCLLALLCIIFASILPGIDATVFQVVAGVTAIVSRTPRSASPARRGGLSLRPCCRRTSCSSTWPRPVSAGDASSTSARAPLRVPDHHRGRLYAAFRPVYELRFASSSWIEVLLTGAGSTTTTSGLTSTGGDWRGSAQPCATTTRT